jgi:hypothetical protein
LKSYSADLSPLFFRIRRRILTQIDFKKRSAAWGDHQDQKKAERSQTSRWIPLFFDKRKQRVVTADPWAFLEHLAVTKLAKNEEARALAYIQQGHEFFEAAQNPRLNSRPLLYYYAFLNLVKAALLIKGRLLPPAAKHGISDPRANSRVRLHFQGQSVHVTGRAHDQSEIFPSFMTALGYAGRLPRTYRVLDLMRQIPSIHRTFVTVEECVSSFAPIFRIELRHKNSQLLGANSF